LLGLLGGGVYLLTQRTLLATLTSDVQTQADQDATFLQEAVVAPDSLEGTARALAPALAGGRSSVRIFNSSGAVLAGPEALGARPSPEALRLLPPSLLVLGLRGERLPGRVYAAQV